jgi:hypothetical protein
MPAHQLPHNRPESDQAFLRRTALELAAIEFQRNLLRDDPAWLDWDESTEAIDSMECLMFCYRLYSTQATCGRTLSERAEAHRFLETLLFWTQGKLVYNGQGDDSMPHWKHAEDSPGNELGGEDACSPPN